MTSNLLYESYHKKIKLQKRIISVKDFTYKNILSKVVRYIPKSVNALDIGSATGTVSFFLASKGLRVDGIELSSNAVRYANLNKVHFSLSNVNFINTSIEKYKSSKKYDLITCFEVLEHIKDDKKCLEKISNYMDKRSILMISVPSKNAPLYKLGLLEYFDRRVGHLRRYSIDDLRNILNLTGFDIINEYKTEGLFRNLMFTNNLFSFLIKFTRFTFINNLISFIDNKSIAFFGESQLILVCKKI